MKLETAQLIAKAADENGLEVQVYDGYSGRGMYGEKTAGLTGSTTDITKATAIAFFELGRSSDEDNKFENLVDDLSWCWDSLGRDKIAY